MGTSVNWASYVGCGDPVVLGPFSVPLIVGNSHIDPICRIS